MAEQPEKRKILPVIAIVAAILIFVAAIIGLAMYRLNSKTPAAQTAGSSVKPAPKKETNITTTLPKPKRPAEDDIIYKGWQTYENAAWKIYARYPPEWTKTETTGSLRVTFLGPSMPGTGVILNECSFGIFIEDVPSGTTLEDYVAAARAQPQGGGGVVTETDTSIGESSAFKVIDTYADVGAPWKRMRVWTIKDGKAYTFSYAASTNYATVDYYTIHSGEADMILESVFLD